MGEEGKDIGNREEVAEGVGKTRLHSVNSNARLHEQVILQEVEEDGGSQEETHVGDQQEHHTPGPIGVGGVVQRRRGHVVDADLGAANYELPQHQDGSEQGREANPDDHNTSHIAVVVDRAVGAARMDAAELQCGEVGVAVEQRAGGGDGVRTGHHPHGDGREEDDEVSMVPVHVRGHRDQEAVDVHH